MLSKRENGVSKVDLNLSGTIQVPLCLACVLLPDLSLGILIRVDASALREWMMSRSLKRFCMP